MIQTQENGKKPHFGPDLGPLGPFWLRQSLDNTASYHHVKYQKNLMMQSWENLMRDGRTDILTEGQTDGQWEWFHRTLSDWRLASNKKKLFVFYFCWQLKFVSIYIFGNTFNFLKNRDSEFLSFVRIYQPMH